MRRVNRHETELGKTVFPCIGKTVIAKTSRYGSNGSHQLIEIEVYDDNATHFMRDMAVKYRHGWGQNEGMRKYRETVREYECKERAARERYNYEDNYGIGVALDDAVIHEVCHNDKDVSIRMVKTGCGLFAVVVSKCGAVFREEFCVREHALDKYYDECVKVHAGFRVPKKHQKKENKDCCEKRGGSMGLFNKKTKIEERAELEDEINTKLVEAQNFMLCNLKKGDEVLFNGTIFRKNLGGNQIHVKNEDLYNKYGVNHPESKMYFRQETKSYDNWYGKDLTALSPRDDLEFICSVFDNEKDLEAAIKNFNKDQIDRMKKALGKLL